MSKFILHPYPKKKRKYTDDIISQWCKLRTDGMSYNEIASKYKTHGGVIHRCISKYEKVDNTIIPNNYRPVKYYMELNNETYQTVMWNIRNRNIKAIKKSSIWYVNIDDKIPSRMIDSWKVEAFKHFKDKGFSQSKTAMLLDVSKSTVQKHLK